MKNYVGSIKSFLIFGLKIEEHRIEWKMKESKLKEWKTVINFGIFWFKQHASSHLLKLSVKLIPLLKYFIPKLALY